MTSGAQAARESQWQFARNALSLDPHPGLRPPSNPQQMPKTWGILRPPNPASLFFRMCSLTLQNVFSH